MSYTNEIKNKLSAKSGECGCCGTAELAGAVRFAGNIRPGGISITTENKNVALCISGLIRENIGIAAEFDYRESAKYYRGDFCGTAADMLCAELALDSEGISELMPLDCCKKAFVTGAFLGGGSISAPEKSYHMEFDTKVERYAKELCNTLAGFGITAKITARKGRSVVYLKDFDSIAAVLGIIGADAEALEFYSVSVEREIRNDVNRKVNCENANLDKLAQAASKQIYAIEKIKRTTGLAALPDTLREMALLRLEYPEESLKELGARLNPPIGKSGVNHRLLRIMNFAQDIKS